ncbi:MAG: hypothetical protein LCH84_02805 [Gemmatimonadetes bacterium]|nr:hypothetical protein [Gemmatimonadota bacterium]
MTFQERVDQASKFVGLISLVVAAAAAVRAWPLDARLKELNTETVRLDQELKRTDAELKLEASRRTLTFDLYKEVRAVLQRADRTTREEDALRVLVESLAEDPLRGKLLEVLSVSANSETVRQEAQKSATFYQDQAVVPTIAATAPAADPSASVFADYAVDVFWCESKRQTSEPIARALIARKPAGATGTWRPRLLPETINRRPGYGITSTLIRYTAPAEQGVATALRDLLQGANVRAALQDVSFSTPRYVSVFICQ